ncbi:MAG: hypothetical protein U1A78_07140 [Polyangia bacterium]
MPQSPSPAAQPLVLRLLVAGGRVDVPATLDSVGAQAAAAFAARREVPGAHVLLTGDRDYLITLAGTAEQEAQVRAQAGRAVWALFPGRSAVRRRLAAFAVGQSPAVAPVPPVVEPVVPAAAEPPGPRQALDLTAGRAGAAPLFLLPDGTFSESAAGPAPTGLTALSALVTAARWISSRRTSTFECLFPPSAFRPDEPLRPERLDATQAEALLAQVAGALEAAAVGGEAATTNPLAAAQLRSAGLTVLAHILGTVRKDTSFRAVADQAAALAFALIDREQAHPTAFSALRSHAIQLLQLRAPALAPADREHAAALLRGLIREAPPYDKLPEVWRFAMCSAWDFHEGEVESLRRHHGFTEIKSPEGSPRPPFSLRAYRVMEAPFVGPRGEKIQIFARSASPQDENREMGEAGFIGVLINRHAQLGAFDMQAAAIEVKQAGYKLMMNTQCAGLTTRFAVGKLFPEADIYSSWDSTFFRTDPKTNQVTESEGLDCFVALLMGMAKKETHAQLSERIKQAQWYHEQARTPGFVQFVGPGHPLVVARYSDVNQDGRADFYDGFLDLSLKQIQSDVEGGATPRDPGVAASQVGGDAATGLGWAAGSLNRVTQYSELWRGLPGDSELLYIFAASGFFSHREPPLDVPIGQAAAAAASAVAVDLGRLPSVCRYNRVPSPEPGQPELLCDVMFHSFLGHAPWELKRLLCAAEALRRALDLGLLPAAGPLATRLGQRGALLLLLAGLLEFPADQNFIDGLWSTALKLLNLPPISRTLVRGCINQADHDASNYYGSVRGLRQLLGDDKADGALKKSDPVAFAKLQDEDDRIGRPQPLELPA